MLFHSEMALFLTVYNLVWLVYFNLTFWA